MSILCDFSLKSIEASEEVGPEGAGDIAWNLAKFLLGWDAALIARSAPTVEPCPTQVTSRIGFPQTQTATRAGTPFPPEVTRPRTFPARGCGAALLPGPSK